MRQDLETIRRIQYAHLKSIPYETFDIHFKRPISTDPHVAYDKIVGAGRGGSCYEQNGLLGLALDEIGFKTRRLACFSEARATHLVIEVTLDGETWICDAGLSVGPMAPYPLKEQIVVDCDYEYRVEFLQEGGFRFHNFELSPARGFDAWGPDELAMKVACEWLQTSPQSPFTKIVPLAGRNAEDRIIVMTDRVLRTYYPDRKEERVIAGLDEYMDLLRNSFHLDIPEASAFWPDICERHEANEREKEKKTSKA